VEVVVGPSQAFWANQRVLVTGHTGFKGAWLSLWLQRLGARVTGFALEPETTPNLSALVSLGTRIDSVVGDIRDLHALNAVYARVRPQVVFHLAAQSLVRPSYNDPVATYATNVMGTIHVMEGARHSPDMKAVVVVTSDKCYENREWWWPYREDDAMGGHDPYSSSKACAELATSAWRRSFFRGTSGRAPVGIASARAGNVIGGGDWAVDRLVPDCIRAFAAGSPVVIRRPESVRPWQHVLDPLAGYLMLAERLCTHPADFGEPWNFGPVEDEARPVRWVVSRLSELWADGAGWTLESGEQPHEAGLLQVDASKARARLRWRPRLGLDEALRWTVDWYQRARQGEDAARLTLEQIDRFASLGEGETA
jgi:CDP-glucose 4,6-dehydratase